MLNDFLKLEEPTPEIMKILINRIEIHQDKQVDIIFNFKKLNTAYNRNSDINLKFILKKQNKLRIKESYFDKTK